MRPHDFFPALIDSGYRVTSPESTVYNCIAWAAGVEDNWWWPDPMGQGYWPPGIPREETMAAFLAAYEQLGFVPCDSHAIELGVEKVALYATPGGNPTHAARQLPSGLWTSKLGPLEDIEHTLTGLEGDCYGRVVRLLKRPAEANTGTG